MTSVDDRADSLALPAPRFDGTARAGELAARLLRAVPWAICAVTAIAAAVRFTELADVVGNPFYDAAVRSMGLSWHNFLFGAFDPGARLAVDKPPLDLWLQVASVKVFGWSGWALKVPEAIGGTLAVPVLYDAVRRAAGRGAGLGAALTLALMPVSVLTSRSDTMDSLMMLVVVVALWLTVRAASRGSRLLLVLAGVALGIAFNVKLLEGLVAVPALALLYAAAAPLSRRERAGDIALAGVALVAVSMSWAVAVTLAPAPHPYAIGSANGSVFAAMFSFNGVGRLAGTLSPGGVFSAPPGVLRLFSPVGSFGRLFGVLLLPALALGLGGLALRWRPRESSAPPLARAFVLAIAVWLACGIAVLSYVSLLHARYLEMVTPAVAAALGCGLAGIVGALRTVPNGGGSAAAGASALVRSLLPVLLLAEALAGAVWFASTLASAPVVVAAALAAAAVLAATVAVLAPQFRPAAAVLAGVLALGACLTFPVRESLAIVREARTDSVGLAAQPRAVQTAISRYLSTRTRGQRYEVAVDNPIQIAPLLVHDARPILPLTAWAGQPLVSRRQLRRAIARGEVSFALVGSYSCPSDNHGAACIPASQWIRAHGIDITAQVPIPRAQRLRMYLLVP